MAAGEGRGHGAGRRVPGSLGLFPEEHEESCGSDTVAITPTPRSFSLLLDFNQIITDHLVRHVRLTTIKREKKLSS